jgi:hypothetical protein
MNARWLIFALAPILSSCQLLELIRPDDRLTLEVKTQLPEFRYLEPNGTTWSTVPPVALSGELVTKDVFGTVAASGTLNPTGVSSLKVKTGNQRLIGTLRSGQVIATGMKDIQPGVGGAPTELRLTATISRVVFVPTKVKPAPGEDINLEYWVFGPVYRVVGVGAFRPLASVSANASLVATDTNTIRVRVAENAQPGEEVSVALSIYNADIATDGEADTRLVLEVGSPGGSL